ncbi:MAG: glycosyltransferase [Bergeyella sp.]
MSLNKLKNMIPKLIHYCWLSNDPYPKEIQQYMKSWKEKLPDYEFILWDFKRFDRSKSLWVEQSFAAKKYAFAADYLRLYALYHYGGIYLDTDVEVFKSFDDLLSLPYVVGTEGGGWIEAGILGSEKGSDWLYDCLAYFEKPFLKPDGSFDMVTLPQVMNRIISEKRKISVAERDEIFRDARENYNTNFYLFQKDFFCAKDMGTGIVTRTSNTYSVHNFAMSWISAKNKFIPNLKRKIISIIGEKPAMMIINLLKK